MNQAHPENGGKARFFRSMGFNLEQWEVLSDALREMACAAPVASTLETAHGTKYVLEGELRSPLGEMAAIRSVWIVDAGAVAPRLVTAYPFG